MKLPPIVGTGALRAGAVTIAAPRRRKRSLSAVIREAVKAGATVEVDGIVIKPAGQPEKPTDAANEWDTIQ
jgi:hypothetical protein